MSVQVRPFMGPPLRSEQDLRDVFRDVSRFAMSDDILAAVYMDGIRMGRVHMYMVGKTMLELIREGGEFRPGADAMRLHVDKGELIVTWLSPPHDNERSEVSFPEVAARSLRVDVGPQYESRTTYVGTVWPSRACTERFYAQRDERERVQKVEERARAERMKAENAVDKERRIAGFKDGSSVYMRRLRKDMDNIKANEGVSSVEFEFPTVSITLDDGRVMQAEIDDNFPFGAQTKYWLVDPDARRHFISTPPSAYSNLSDFRTALHIVRDLQTTRIQP